MKVVVAITGASGSIVGLRLIEELEKKGVEVIKLISKVGKQTLEFETKQKFKPDYDVDNFFVPIGSSSHKIDAVVVCPCSMKTLSAIANGYANNLIVRAADNCLKMKKKLILCARETPINLVHIENMRRAALAGAIIMPLCTAYYFKPKSVENMIDFFVGKILDLLDIDHNLYKRWKE